MKEGKLICAVIIAMVIVALTSFAEAQPAAAEGRTGRFFAGAAMGFQTNTADSTAFALGFSGDYYLTRDFSIGPLLQLGFTNDLSQVGLTAQAKYTVDFAENPDLKPYVQAGMGIIHADLDRRGRSDTDTSFLMPFGVGAEYKLTSSVFLDTSFLFNFTNLDVHDKNENFFFTWLVGLKFPF